MADPFEPYLNQAEGLFQAGDIVKAGQIWQAILKRVPDHAIAKAGLNRVKQHFNVRSTHDQVPEDNPGASAGTTTRAPEVSDATRKEVAQLIEQGCTLYDAGHIEDAHQRWEKALQKDPNHPLARGYINMARKLLDLPLLEIKAAPLPERSKDGRSTAPQGTGSQTQSLTEGDLPPRPRDLDQPAPPPEIPPEPEDDDTLLRKGCTLFDMGQLEDAKRAWERLLFLNPHHPQVKGYLRQVRRELYLDPLPELEESEAEVAAQASEPTEDTYDRLEQLVKDGVQLYDMGMVAEAVARWEQVLETRPDHSDALGYLEMARRDPNRTTMAPPPPPPPIPTPRAPEPPATAAPNYEIQQALTQCERLMQFQRFEEAVEMYQRILQADPGNTRALQGYSQARSMAQAMSAPPPPPVVEAAPPEPPPVDPPAAVQAKAMALPRKGLEPPEALKKVTLPTWATSPKVLAIIGGGAILLLVAFFSVKVYLRDARLKQDIQQAKTAAAAVVARSTQVQPLEETPEGLRIASERAFPEDPLLGYLHAQALLKLQPDSPAAPNLIERAKNMLGALPPPTQTPKDVDRLVAEGNLDEAKRVVLLLLNVDPEQAELRQKGARIALTMAQLNAHKELWDDARENLVLAHALQPQGKAGLARLRLLDHIRTLPKAERGSWIPLLG